MTRLHLERYLAGGEVWLLQPPGICRTFTRSSSVYPPLGLAQLAAVDTTGQVRVLDAEGWGLTEGETLALIERYRPRIIGLTTTSFTLHIVERWAARGKALGARIVVGGVHATLAPEDTFRKCPSVDYIVRGEGELIINDLVRMLSENGAIASLQGLCVREGDNFHIDQTILQVKPEDFEELPFPGLEGLAVANYWAPDARRRPMMTLMTARGCPFRCAFCSSPTYMGRKIRGWSPEAVGEYLEYLIRHGGVRQVAFSDDVFNLPPKRAIAICEEILRRNLDLTWYANARADLITEEMADVMKRAGCHQLYLGFESGSQIIPDNIHKSTTLDKLIRGAEILKKYGIDRSIGFIIGLPGETEETVRETIELAKRLRPERIQFARFTPLVGSPLADYAAENVGFHNHTEDQIGRWIQRAYAECGYETWGKPSL